MENYVVSARKYRPALFKDVVGQEPIVTTLQNALKSKQLAHAFLFCGPRGVGKTTCARILAKAINCFHPTIEAEPCNACISCISFNNRTSFNMYELDAASNNSVEDIRSLVEQVRYPPQQGAYKIYIIDEVHMLSQSAFNAFLKTLEEPPSYAIFILATTERHKIIPTILSRCQLFDFQRVSSEQMIAQLKQIAERESIVYQEEALHLISQKSDGALRDALSMFDVMVNYGRGALTYQIALDHLHVLDYTYYFKLTAAFIVRDVAAVLLFYEDIMQLGFDGLYFLEGLLAHFRNLLVAQEVITIPLLSTSLSVQENYRLQAATLTPVFLLEALRVTNLCAIQYKESINKRLHVELVLIELTMLMPQGVSTTSELPIQPASLSTPSSTPTVSRKLTNSSANLPRSPNKATTSLPSLPNRETVPKASFPTTIKIPQLADLKADLEQSIPSVMADTIPQQENIPLVYEEVVACWQAYAQVCRSEQRIPAYNLLQKTFTLVSTTITMPFTNTIEEHILAEIKEHLLAHLRKNLKNTAIDVVGVFTSQDIQSSAKLYTAQEKFHHLLHKNPVLALLKEQLQLALIN